MTTRILVFTFFILSAVTTWAQIPDYNDNCAGKPCVGYLPENKIVKIGDDEIHLGEGIIDRYNVTDGTYQYSYNRAYEFRYPCNHPTWPIAMVHAWSLFRSTTGIVNHSINSAAAIVTNESQMACGYNFDMSCLGPAMNHYDSIVDNGQPWPNNKGAYLDYVTENATFIANNSGSHADGCFHIDGLGRANLRETTSACETCGFFKTEADAVANVQKFETAVLSRTYYDLSFLRHLEDVQGYDAVTVFNSTNDSYATDEIFAYAYNKGPYGAILGMADVVFNTNRAGAIASSDWIGSGYVTGIDYNESVRRYDRVLSNDYTPLTANDPQRWLNWYDNDITWAVMTDYLDAVIPMHKLTAAEEAFVRSEIQTVFDQQKDASGNVSFRYKLGPIIDRLVAILPYTEPSYTNTSSQNAVSTCKGCVGPYVTISTDYTEPICNGQSVKLETLYGADYTYVWIKDEQEIANPNSDPNIFYATESGSYSVVVIDEKDCAIRADVNIDIVVTSCSSCDLQANLSQSSNSCTDVPDGSIQVSLSGASYNPGGSYVYEWTNPDGSTLNINQANYYNLIQGNYLLKAYDLADASCAAFSNAVLTEDQEVYQKLDIAASNINCDNADLTAEVTGNPPRNCDYRLGIYGTPDNSGQCWGLGWVDTEHRLVINLNGASIGNRNPDWPGGGTCTVFDESFGVAHGDEIEIVIKGLSCNSVTALNRNFKLYDSNNDEVASVDVGALSKGENIIISEIASCEQPVINYNITATNTAGITLQNEVSNPNLWTSSTVGTGWVKVEATTSENSCVLKDSIQLTDLCNACLDPETVTLETTDPLTQCEGTVTFTANQTGTAPSGGFQYEFFRGGVSVQGPSASNTYIATATGSYTVEVSDPSDPLTCNVRSSSVNVQIDKLPSNSIAGNDSTICNDFTNLEANDPTTGTGVWSVITGSGTIDSPTSYATNISGLGLGVNKFRWTISNGTCPDDTNSVTINLLDNITSANAGTDQTICSSDATLGGNTVAGGEIGTWSLLTGSGTIADVNNPTSSVSGLGTGTNIFLWTISNGVCPDDTNSVVINLSNTTTTANAGTDETICDNSTLLNANSVGSGETGTWSLVSGSGTFTDVNSENTEVTNLGLGSNKFLWTISNGNCPDDTNSVIITTEAKPSTSSAGDDLTICSDVATMSATAPTVGTGQWSIVSGTATIVNALDNNTDITGIADGTTVLRWTVSNGSCTDSTDEISITKTTNAIAGVVISPGTPAPVCTGASFVFNAIPSNGGTAPQYEWFINNVSQGPASSVDSIEVNAPSDGDQISVTMTSNLGCATGSPATSSVVDIALDEVPDLSNAGTDQTLCLDNTLLDGNTPSTGNGQWTVVQGAGNLVDDTSPTSQINNLATGENILVWTISNGTCPANTDTVKLTVSGSITTPNAGLDQELCETQTTTALGANAAQAGETGTWSVKSGSATFDNSNNPTTNISGLSVGKNTLIWTLDNGVCTPALDSVDIYVYATPSTSLAGDDQSNCLTSTSLAANTPGIGSGTWTVVSGSANITDQNSATSAVEILTSPATLRWTISNGSSCPESSDEVIITVTNSVQPTVTISADQNPACFGDDITFTATPMNGGAAPEFEWFIESTSQGAPSSTNTLTTNALFSGAEVTVQMTGISSCGSSSSVTSDPITMNMLTAPNPMLNPSSIRICEGNSVTLTTLSGANVKWFKNGVEQETNTSISISNIGDTGNWHVEEDNGVCPPATSAEAVVQIDQKPTVDAGEDITIDSEETASLNGSSSSDTLVWTPSNFVSDATILTPTATPTSTTTFTLTAYSGSCTTSDSMTVQVYHAIKVPNVITPNNDGEGDTWYIHGITEYPNAEIFIYSRWGRLVYRALSSAPYWDGNGSNSKQLPLGTYYYVINLNDGTNNSLNGTVTIVR